MFTRWLCKQCYTKYEYRRSISANPYTVYRDGGSHRGLRCIECNRTFLAKQQQTKYCSPMCSYHKQLSFTPRKKPNRRIIAKTCKICNESYLGASNTVYCSKECKAVYGRIRQKEYRERTGYSNSDRARDKRRRARRKNAEGNFTTKDLLMLEQIQQSCQHPRCNKTSCDNGDSLHLHHIVPLSEGGTNYIDNIQRLCAEHHQELHSEKIV